MHEQQDENQALAFARVLFPGLAEEIDRAHAVSRGGTGSANDRVDAWLDRETEKLRSTVLTGVAFAEVADDEVRARFAASFRAARRVAQWGGLDVPTIESFTAAGVDVAGLGQAASGDVTLQLVPAPYGLGLAGWQEIFRQAAAVDTSALQGSGLLVSTEVEREFSGLDRVPTEDIPTLRVESDRRASEAQFAAPPREVHWTLRLIPASPAPPVVGLSFAHGPHVSLPEMLMLQASRAAEGMPMIDERSFTWLAGETSEGKLAVRHIFDASEGSVRLSAREPGQQGPHLGARPPVG